MPKLAVIPSDPLEAYKRKGTASWLKDYYNPLHLFDEVYLLSPLEKKQRYEFGMNIIPTNPKQFKNCIKELNIDIVRAYGGYWACDMACKNKISGVPVVVSVHDTNPNLLYNSIKNADIVFCMSKVVKNLVLTKFKKKDRAWILQNRVDFDVMHPYPKEKIKDLENKFPFKYKILHIGRKTRQKNLDTVIKALKLLGDNYCLLAIGRGKKDEYIKLAKELEIKKQCNFIDSIPNEELPYYYSLADCMCVPSRWEGFGVVFIEALACETIIITSDIAPMNEYIEHTKNGFLVKDYENPRALAETITVACNDKHLREFIKKNARKSVKRFEKSRIDKLEVGYYKKILLMAQNDEFNVKLPMLRNFFPIRSFKKKNLVISSSNLDSKEWHNVMIGGRYVHNLANKIRGKQFPVWCKPLSQHSSPGDSMLELGSGTGELSAILGIHGRIPHLLDFSAESIDYAKALFKELGIKGYFYCADILEGIPMETSSIDWVWSSGLLEHFSDEQIIEILKESVLVCKKGVMSLVPNASSIFYRIGKFKMEQEGTWLYGKEIPKFTMEDYFKAASLKNIKEYSVGTYHSLQFWGKHEKEIKKFYDNLGHEELQNLNQGYLLFTYGEK